MRWPGVMRRVVEGGGELGAGKRGGEGDVGGGSGAPPLLHPADRLAWWDGVSHVVTRLICLDHLDAVGPLKFRWTTWKAIQRAVVRGGGGAAWRSARSSLNRRDRRVTRENVPLADVLGG